ncbi:MAG TPA: trypsin-like serine protease [Streptosporangiaceae bacterium]|nr:trypsin-like serine protease [Streptosporangiaceae bacterium]
MTGRRRRLTHGARRPGWFRPTFEAAVIVAAAAVLAVANVASASLTGLDRTAAWRRVPGQRTGSAFNGTRAVGALLLRRNGHLGRHFCTASVVHSPAGDLLLTAAHCMRGLKLKPAGGVVFAPGYHRGRMPLGLWVVTAEFVTTRWASRHDPNDDFAFLVVSGHHPIERSAGAERLRTATHLPAQVQVIGYPDTTSSPIRCTASAHAFDPRTLRQMKFVCGGYTDGTSGGPFLFHVSPRTKDGAIIGVIGGYQEGGDTPAISYSPVFSVSIAALYRTATAPGAPPSPSPTPTPSTSTSTSPSATPAPSPSPTPTPTP